MRKATILLAAPVVAVVAIHGGCLVSIPEVSAPSCDAGAGCDTSEGFDVPPDPCLFTTVPYGWFCGTSTQLGFDPSQADPKTIYYCLEQLVADAQSCDAGCSIAEAGIPDKCNDGG